MLIKTIHIDPDLSSAPELLWELYNLTLKSDSNFHFFYEQEQQKELIIRISEQNCLAKVKESLQAKNISFDEYDYPRPCPPEGRFGKRHGEDGIVADDLELFVPIFHANSVAALTMNEGDHLNYLERLIHTAFNPGGYSRPEEGEKLKQCAEWKLGYKLSRSTD